MNSSAVEFVDDMERPTSFTEVVYHYCSCTAAAAGMLPLAFSFSETFETFCCLVTKHVYFLQVEF